MIFLLVITFFTFIIVVKLALVISLGYLILNDGRVLNEIMTKEGYAKPYKDVFCKKMPMCQEWIYKLQTT